MTDTRTLQIPCTADTAGVTNTADAAAAVGVVGLCPGAGDLVDTPDVRPPVPAAGRDDIAPCGVPVEGKYGAVVGLDGTGRGAMSRYGHKVSGRTCEECHVMFQCAKDH